MPYKPIAPYLDFSDSTGRVYIVMSENKKIDVTVQFEFIVKERERATIKNTDLIPTCPVPTEIRPRSIRKLRR